MLPSAVSDSRVHNILPNKIETDFQFSRASAATRVNHQGLIEEVGYFGPELVQNGDFSELGNELIVNGDFATDSDWTISGGNAEILNGKLNFNNAASYGTSVANSASVVSGKTYLVQFTISNYSSGAAQIRLGSQFGTSRNANGTYTEYIVANATLIRLYSSSDNTTLSIDNVSVKQVDPDDDWTLGTGWSYGSDKITGSATQAEISQDIDLPSGKVYKATFTIEDYVSGQVRIRFRGGTTVNGTPHGGNGTYTEILTSTGHTNIKIDGTSSFTGSVTNISVVEVIGDKPRLDYDPLNPTCPHLLLEPQSTNLVTFSEDFSQWDSIGSTQTSTPNLNPIDSTAYKIESTVNTSSRIFISGIMTSTNTYSSSYLVKATSNSPQYLGFACISNTVPDVLYNFANDQFEDNTISGNAAKCESISMINDWKLLKVPVHSSVTNTRFNIYQGSKSGNQLVGTIGQSYFIKLAQLEELSFCTSYIPTSGSTETRVQETCTNAGNVDTFNSTEGVLYAEIAALADDSTNRRITISDGTTNNRMCIGFSNAPNKIKYFLISSNVSQVNQDVSVSDITQSNKIAFKFKTNDFKLYMNGSLISSDTSGNTFSTNTLNVIKFAGYTGTTQEFYGKVKSLATYNRALTDTELYTITSTQYSAYSGMVAALGNYTIPC